jgi:hypothetical protein
LMLGITPPNHEDYHEGKSFYINESGIYTTILGSRKPDALGFQCWVTGDLLPTLRQTGIYHLNPLLMRAETGQAADIPGQPTSTSPSGPTSSSSKLRTKPGNVRALPLPGESLADLVKAHRPDVTGVKKRHLLMKVSLQLMEVITTQSGRTDKETEKLLSMGPYGQTTQVPTEYVEVACGLLRQDKELNVTGGAQPALGEEKDEAEPGGTRCKRRRSAFCASTTAHAAAKEAANQLFLNCLRAHSIDTDSPVVILDAFTTRTGFELRSLSTLQRANFRNVFVVNPDEGICNAARGQNASVFQGTWEEAGISWILEGQSFAAVYLDLCSGSVAYLERQLRLASRLSASKAVLAYTVLERDFDGFLLIQRLRRLDDLLLGEDWVPGLTGWEASSLAYRTGAGQQAVTQVWRRGS